MNAREIEMYKDGLDETLVEFLTENPGAKRSDIDRALTDLGYSRYVINKAIPRCKKLGRIYNEGRTQQTRWYAKTQ